MQPDLQASKLERQALPRIMNDKLVSAFYQAYGFGDLRQAAVRLIDGLVRVADSGELEFRERLGEATALLEDLGGKAADRPDPLGTQIAPLRRAAASAIQKVEAQLAARFDALIEPKCEGYELPPKRYPLHETGKRFDISIPMINTGPGWARDVGFAVIADDENISIAEVLHNIGDVRVGDFVVTFPAQVMAPAPEAK